MSKGCDMRQYDVKQENIVHWRWMDLYSNKDKIFQRIQFSWKTTKGRPKQREFREKGFELANPGVLTEEASTLALIQYT